MYMFACHIVHKHRLFIKPPENKEPVSGTLIGSFKVHIKGM